MNVADKGYRLRIERVEFTYNVAHSGGAIYFGAPVAHKWKATEYEPMACPVPTWRGGERGEGARFQNARTQ